MEDRCFPQFCVGAEAGSLVMTCTPIVARVRRIRSAAPYALTHQHVESFCLDRMQQPNIKHENPPRVRLAS